MAMKTKLPEQIHCLFKYIPSLSLNSFKYFSKKYFVAVASESSSISYIIMGVNVGRLIVGLLFWGNNFSFKVGHFISKSRIEFPSTFTDCNPFLISSSAEMRLVITSYCTQHSKASCRRLGETVK